MSERCHDAAAPSPAPTPVTIATAPPKETRLILDGTEVHDLASKANGRSYQIGRAFMKQMEQSRYNLALRSRIIEGERHAGGKHEAYNRGLRHVLAPLEPNPSK